MISIDRAMPDAAPRPQPLYVMIKPPPAQARLIECQRRLLGIDNGYGRERLHTTLLPLGDGRDLPAANLALIRAALASLQAEPFRIAFDRLSRKVLLGRQGLRELRGFQGCLTNCLTAAGVMLPAYRFRPHLSVTYHDAPERTVAIPPIGWLVEEFLLIRSLYGEGRHERLGRWPLVARQGCFGF